MGFLLGEINTSSYQLPKIFITIFSYLAKVPGV